MEEGQSMSQQRRPQMLIANRGEIAVRIIRACREMGIATIAVYSDVDRLSPHVLLADKAAPIGPAPPLESYLNSDHILSVAEKTGADMVHPGYGFLAESAEFAEQVQAAGLLWVGPPPAAIRLMGSKTEARKCATKAGVPVIPGVMEPLKDCAELQAFAEEHGLPVLVKAVGGGGGKGMRVVAAAEQLAAAFERARSEGAAYFGNPDVYVEKLVERPRHIEVQVVADEQGNAVHVGERECSIQRRHQKVLEECPSPMVDSQLRQRLGDAALAIVRHAGYSSVGTVEFLVDEAHRFYFLEMNTRLQVEHPVTEEVWGVDLVQEQIRLALGKPLSLQQQQLHPQGHALECRVYAEDALRGFAPCPGEISHLQEPAGPGVRIDSGVRQASVVPLEYDPLLAKLVVWAPDREQALARLGRALEEYTIRPLATTLPLFRALLRSKAFVDAQLHTGSLDELLSSGALAEVIQANSPQAQEIAIIAAACLASLEVQQPSAGQRDHRACSSWWEEGLRVLHGRSSR